MNIAYSTVIGYFLAAIGVGLFGRRSLMAYRVEQTRVLKHTGQGLLLLALAELLYSVTHLIRDRAIRTDLVALGETVLLVGVYVVSDFTFSYWGNVWGYPRAGKVLRRLLLLVVVLVIAINIIFLALGYRGPVEILSSGFFSSVGHSYYSQSETFPVYTAYLEGFLILVVGCGAGLALVHQGQVGGSKRSLFLGVGVLFCSLAGVLLTVISTSGATVIGIVLLVLGISGLVAGLLTKAPPELVNPVVEQ